MPSVPPSIACVILAAGAGRRAGGPKAFLPFSDVTTSVEETFLAHVARVAREGGAAPIVAVVRPQDRDRAAAATPGLALAVNPDPERGMLSSLRAGLDALAPVAGVLIFPVDHPHVRPGTVGALLQAFDADPSTGAKPSFEGRGGHPVVLPWVLAESLPAADVPGGLGEALRQAGARVAFVPVDDPGVLRNVNGLADRGPG